MFCRLFTLLFLCSLLTSLTSALEEAEHSHSNHKIKHKCIHDEIQSKQKIFKTHLNYASDKMTQEGRRVLFVPLHTTRPLFPSPTATQQKKQINVQRTAESVNWENIRIAAYFDHLEATNDITTDQKSYAKELTSSAIRYFQELFLVERVDGPLVFDVLSLHCTVHCQSPPILNPHAVLRSTASSPPYHFPTTTHRSRMCKS